MNNPAKILVVDDNPANRYIFERRLSSRGYEILTATDGEQGLAVAREIRPDLILLDVMMPKMDGIEVCRRLKSDPACPFIPIIMVTAKVDPKDVVEGLDSGADEYLTKPVDHTALVARVKSMLRIKTLHDKTEEQANQMKIWNEELNQPVSEQLVELERMNELKRFFSPQIAELITSPGNEKLLESRRREITVVFCDLRNFVRFSESAEPEEIMKILREYHLALGPLIHEFDATLERFPGDGLMVYFNDPVTCEAPSLQAIQMAVTMRDRITRLIVEWRGRGYDLGFGIGIASGQAVLGQIGFLGRFDYGAVGLVVNLASRLCDRAKDGQILISEHVSADVEDAVIMAPLPDILLKGFSKPISAYNVAGLKAAHF